MKTLSNYIGLFIGCWGAYSTYQYQGGFALLSFLSLWLVSVVFAIAGEQ